MLATTMSTTISPSSRGRDFLRSAASHTSTTTTSPNATRGSASSIATLCVLRWAALLGVHATPSCLPWGLQGGHAWCKSMPTICECQRMHGRDQGLWHLQVEVAAVESQSEPILVRLVRYAVS